MRAVIMAGGEGSRLRPLTCTCPKPMVPLCGKPVMAWAVELLRRHGVRDIVTTLMYMPDAIIDHFGDGSDHGVRVTHSVETSPLGTAGSVKLAEAHLTEPFILISGDALTDIDLTCAMRAHRQSGAIATMVLRRVEKPLEYGVVVLAPDGRVQGFIEKPGWSRVFSDLANTGIYLFDPSVFEFIPAGKPFDFGKDLFPMLVERGLPVYGHVTQDYWCDIGDPVTYLSASFDALEGRVKLDLPACGAPGVFVHPEARVHEAAVLTAPVMIGRNAVIEASARVGPHAVLGEGALAARGASVKRSIVWQDAHVMQGAALRGAILMDGARVERGASAYEGAIIGSRSVIGERASVSPGIKVWPDKQVEEATRLREHIVWGERAGPGFAASCFSGSASDVGASAVALAAAAFVKSMKLDRVALAFDGTLPAQPLLAAALSGLQSAGAEVFRLSACTASDLRFGVTSLRLSGGVYVRLRGLHAEIMLCGADGAPFDDSAMRKIESLYRRGDPAITQPELIRETHDVRDVPRYHRASILSQLGITGHARHPPVSLFCPGEALLARASALFREAGVHARTHCVPRGDSSVSGDEIGFSLTRDGECVVPFSAHGALERASHPLWTARVFALRHPGGTFVAAMDDTDALEHFCEGLGIAVLRRDTLSGGLLASLCAAPVSSAERVTLQHLLFDGAAAALYLVDALDKLGLTLDAFRASIPPVFIRRLSVPCPDARKAAVMRGLTDQLSSGRVSAREGVRVRVRGGWAWIVPSTGGQDCRILCEAASAEAAEELGVFYSDIVKKLSKG